MKILLSSFPIFACLLPLSTLAQGSNVPTGNGSENCLNKSQTPECEPCEEEESCGTQDGVEDETNSFVHTGMLDYHAWSYDFKLPGTAAGCSPCGSNTGINTSLHSVMVKRYSRTRTRNTSIHSFGRVSTLAGYDVNFQWAENSIEKFVDFTDSGKYNAQTTLKWNSSRQTWAPRFAVDAAFGLTLYDSTGNPLTAYWNRDLAHTGVFLRADGGTIHFEIIRKGD